MVSDRFRWYQFVTDGIRNQIIQSDVLHVLDRRPVPGIVGLHLVNQKLQLDGIP